LEYLHREESGSIGWGRCRRTVFDEKHAPESSGSKGTPEFKVLESKGAMDMFLLFIQKSDRRVWRFGRLNE